MTDLLWLSVITSHRQCDTSGVKNIVSAAVGSQYIVYVNADGKTSSKGVNDKRIGGFCFALGKCYVSILRKQPYSWDLTMTEQYMPLVTMLTESWRTRAV